MTTKRKQNKVDAILLMREKHNCRNAERNNIKRAIRKCMTELNLSYEDVAEILGRQKQTMWMYFNGRSENSGSLEITTELCNIFDLELIRRF